MSEKKRQKDKEEAVLLALQNDMALIRDGLSIFGMKKDGSRVLLSESNGYETLWGDVLTKLRAND